MVIVKDLIIMDKLLEMIKDRSALFSWVTGSGVGGASGLFPPDYISSIKLYIVTINSGFTISRLVDLLWVVLTTFVATTVSFFITRAWKSITEKKVIRRSNKLK